jgi:aryl-alcohol dehydrogenase-like predicted oxidoreductase
MLYQQLGNSAMQISRIGFGCMSLKGDAKTNEQLLDHAAASGINYFDTADLYDKGENELLVGRALKHRRKEIILATKVGNQWRADGSGWDWNPRKQYILQAVEKSLQRLQTDYIDLYQLHGGRIEDPIDETIEAFELLVNQGKIRYYGISSIRPNVIREWVQRSRIISVMMQYSLLDRRPEETVFEWLQKNNISVLARGSLAQGLLIDKPAKDYLGHDIATVKKAAAAIRQVSGQDGGASHTAVQFVLQNPVVASAVVGIRTRAQLEDVVGSLKTPFPGEESIEKLREIVPAKYYQEHR